ncbi:MAG: nitrilase [Bacteroidetes bacterium]|jgi:nitrilase|nr:nitrilase [Bacteroidota bacterium]
MKDFKAGCVQATPSLFNKEETVNGMQRWVQKAAGEDVKLLIFPESYVPGYPAGLGFGTVVGSRTEKGRQQFRELWENSVEVPGPETDRMGEMAKTHKMLLVVGVTERDSISKTLYCTLLYFGANGQLLGKHRKLKPTAAERLIWGEGDGTTLSTFDTDLGVIGGLICWENYMPLARMAMYKKGIEIYVAPTADARDSWTSTMIHIAREGRCYVIGCNQIIRKEDYPNHLRPELADDRPEVLSRGGSVIVSPMGDLLAGPLYNEEGLLTAELQQKTLIESKMDFDVIGHYSRNDVFNLSVKNQPEIKKADE